MGILGEIVERKRGDLKLRLGDTSLEEMRARAAPTEKSLKLALSQPGARFICEIKRASPSAGMIASDLDVPSLARAYKGVADAISVLTDRPFFAGSFEDLERVRKYFDGPILAKDFLIDPRQVAEARIHGADAILVMLSILTPSEAAAMIREAELFGMDALVEVHDEIELQQALALGAPLIGINNRDLRTLEVDLSVTERLAPFVPKDRTLVAESGISSRSDVERLSPLVDAFLIGSSLMSARAPALRARELAFGRVKICGLTSPADVELAADRGASYAGFIFAPKSPRTISVENAGMIALKARERGLKSVGVFRNEAAIGISMIASRLSLDAIQLHGDEDEAYIAKLKTYLRGRSQIWAASPVGSEPARAREGADRNLFDTLIDGKSGGTGRSFDWSLVNFPLMRSGLLAGGLNPSNINAAAATGAWGLDVGSGVERAPGSKCPERMEALFEALRPAARGEAILCN
jgi:indole-3-glycerol phosphate synthase/phosphoribosylanthranilate isomerase